MKQTWRFVLLLLLVLTVSALFIVWLQSLNLQTVYFIATLSVIAAAILGLLLWKGMTHG